MANIYISSTYSDLLDERQAVKNSIIRMGHQPVDSYTAMDLKPLEACLSDVRQCQCYIGILGFRYGSIAHPHGKSYTELEFEEAGKCNIPRLIFLRGDAKPLRGDQIDDDTGPVDRFRKRASTDRIVDQFVDSTTLMRGVEKAIQKSLGRGVPVPDILSWSANRTLQEEVFETALSEWKYDQYRPLVCVLHGDEYQGLDKAMDRLRALIPRVVHPGSEDSPPKDHVLEWPSMVRSVDDVKSGLRKKLSREVLDELDAHVDDISHVIARHPGNVTVQSHLITDDWRGNGQRMLDGFLAFWREWPDLAAERKLVVFLAFKYLKKRDLGFFARYRLNTLNSRVKAQLDGLGQSGTAVVLPELEGVSRSEAEAWARSSGTREFCGGQSPLDEIRDLFDKWEAGEPNDVRIPMELLAKSLKTVLYRHNHVREM